MYWRDQSHPPPPPPPPPNQLTVRRLYIYCSSIADGEKEPREKWTPAQFNGRRQRASFLLSRSFVLKRQKKKSRLNSLASSRVLVGTPSEIKNWTFPILFRIQRRYRIMSWQLSEVNCKYCWVSWHKWNSKRTLLEIKENALITYKFYIFKIITCWPS